MKVTKREFQNQVWLTHVSLFEGPLAQRLSLEKQIQGIQRGELRSASYQLVRSNDTGVFDQINVGDKIFIDQENEDGFKVCGQVTVIHIESFEVRDITDEDLF